MTIHNFTPIESFSGGLMIGLAALILLYANGQIAGISGILGQALRPGILDRLPRFLFLAGLPLGVFLFSLTQSAALTIQIDAPVTRLVLAGLLVGFGTRLGNGCTSGHGVCGIGRLSRRSIIATLVFMGTAFLTVAITHHLFGMA